MELFLFLFSFCSLPLILFSGHEGKTILFLNLGVICLIFVLDLYFLHYSLAGLLLSITPTLIAVATSFIGFLFHDYKDKKIVRAKFIKNNSW